MTNKELLNLLDERNNGDYTNCLELYKYLNDSNLSSVHYLLELFFEDKSRFIVGTNVAFADVLKLNNINAARYLYLYDIIMNPKKYSFCFDIFTDDAGLRFENEWENLLKADKKVKYALYLYASDYINKDKVKKVDKLVDKALNTENPIKKEKLLLKAISYNDPYPVFELANFYYETGNKDLGLEYYQKAFEMHYVDAGLFLADYYHNKNNVDKEIEYLSKSIRKNDYKITYRLLKLLQKHNKSLELVYPFLEWNVYRNECLCYELASLYETGEFVKKDELSAYFLYMCARDYLDSKDKLNQLKEKLKVTSKAKSQEIFDTIIAKIDEEKALKEKIRKEKALEAKRQKEESERLESQKSFDFDYDPNCIRRSYDTDSSYDDKVNLYKEAYTKKEHSDIIDCLVKAAEEGHEKARYNLAYYYKNIDEVKFKEYLYQIIYGDIPYETLDKLNIDFDMICNLAKNENEYGLTRLMNYVDSKISQDYLNEIDKLAKKNNPYAIDFLFKYYFNRKKRKNAEEYAYLKALTGDPYFLISNYLSKGVTKETKPEYVDLLLKEEYQDNVDVVLCIYDVITNNELREHFNIPYRPWAVDLLHALENVESKKQRYRVYHKLAECYEKGIGTLKNLEKAMHYYYECEESKKGNEIRNEIMYNKRCERETQERSSELMALHPCPELDRWVSMGSTKAKNIVKRYGEISRSEAIKDMIERDELLKLGFTLNEMHDDLGNFTGYKLEKEIKKRIQEKYPTPVVINNQPQQVIQQEVVLEPIENNIKFVLFGKLKEDPFDPDNNDPVFHRYFASTVHTDTYRKLKKRTEQSYGEMECFYVEELIIDGQKINTTNFYYHLNMTLEPGIHSATVTVCLRNHFAGYKLSSYAFNRPIIDEFDYYPDNAKKGVWKRYRKTLTIPSFEVKPGKIYYLAFWALLYGEYRRVYDGLSKLYVGAELKQTISDFSFDVMTEKQVIKKGNFYNIDEEDFMSIEDFGNIKYNPLEERPEDIFTLLKL